MNRSFAIAIPDDAAELVDEPAVDLATEIELLERLTDQFFLSAALLLDGNPRALPYSLRAQLPALLVSRERVKTLIAQIEREVTP